ncbi:hypothetical protein P153DRAFT_277858, partial [Dothidotthia symphoricarpi CBS 119687]
SNMTTALPIIPPRPAGIQRPKLQIDTQQSRTFGKGASLRLETLSAISPTVRNTFSNAYQQQQQQPRPQPQPQLLQQHPAPPAPPQPSAAPAPGPRRPAKPQLSLDSNLTNTSSASTPSSASTLSSTLTSASSDSATTSIPYKQPHNLTSILANSPVKSILPRKMASSRPMFPAEKRVSFRTPLEEHITTVKYTLAHSDISSSTSTLLSLASTQSSDSDISTMNLSTTSDSSFQAPTLLVQPPCEKTTSANSTLESPPRPKGPRAGDKRDSSSSEDDSDSCPETPVAGRRKLTRDWRWTLAPLSGDSGKSTPSTSDAGTSEDSS